MTFIITGQRPDNKMSEFIRAMDLGIERVMIPFRHELTTVISDDATPEQIAALPETLRLAYERAGGMDVVVQLIEKKLRPVVGG